jgi:hypothetical protein
MRRTIRVISVFRFVVYPLPLLIITLDVCLTQVLRANGVPLIIIVLTDAIPIAAPAALIWAMIKIGRRRALKQFRDQYPEFQ